MYENDHFNQTQAEFKKEANGKSKQAQAEFKKEANGKSKPVAQKKKKEKKEGVYHALREWLGAQIALLILDSSFFYNWLYLI